MADHPVVDDAADKEARRKFLLRCGRFAVVTPPMMGALLTVSSIPSEARASSIGNHQGGNNQGGNNQGGNNQGGNNQG
jgi:hypothetical protein